MKRNILFLATLMMLAFIMIACPLFFTNCSNDPEMDAQPPSFTEVVVTPSTPKAGEKFNVTLKIKSMGKSWYKLNYNWTLTNNRVTPIYSIKGGGYTLEMKEPTFDIAIPDTAKAGPYTLKITKLEAEASSLYPDGSLRKSVVIENSSVTLNVQEAEPK